MPRQLLITVDSSTNTTWSWPCAEGFRSMTYLLWGLLRVAAAGVQVRPTANDFGARGAGSRKACFYPAFPYYIKK